jgi:hypothetical protein
MSLTALARQIAELRGPEIDDAFNSRDTARGANFTTLYLHERMSDRAHFAPANTSADGQVVCPEWLLSIERSSRFEAAKTCEKQNFFQNFDPRYLKTDSNEFHSFFDCR